MTNYPIDPRVLSAVGAAAAEAAAGAVFTKMSELFDQKLNEQAVELGKFQDDIRRTISANDAIQEKRLEKAIFAIGLDHFNTRKLVECLLDVLNHTFKGAKGTITARHKVYKRIKKHLLESFGVSKWEVLPMHRRDDVYTVIHSLAHCHDFKDEYLKSHFKSEVNKLKRH